MTTTAPGQINVDVDENRGKCVVLYRKAHEIRKPKMAEVKSRIETSKKSLESNMNDQTQGAFMDLLAMYSALGTQIDQVMAYDDTKFNEWYDTDMQDFKNTIDKDGNGKIDGKEFEEWMTGSFNMSKDDAEKVFAAWDIDKGGSIGPFEYCTLMAVWHAELAVLEVAVVLDTTEALLSSLFPCGICCLVGSMYCGAALCCCTLGLSCIPFCCQIKSIANKMEETDNQKMADDGADMAQKQCLETTRAFLMKGPSDSLANVTRQSQK